MADSRANHFEVSEIRAIRADAEKFSEDDIVRLCDFTLELLGPCCTKPETCERECIYRWKHAAQGRQAAVDRCAKECDEQAERYERRADDLTAKGPLTFGAEIDRWRCRANQARRDATAIRALGNEREVMPLQIDQTK